jgi:hypothetical protein
VEESGIVGDSEWFTVEPVCIRCKEELGVNENGSGYTGFIEMKCACRRMIVNGDVLRVIERLNTSAEKTALLNGYVGLSMRASEMSRPSLDVEATVKAVQEFVDGAPLNKERMVEWLEKRREV